MQLQRLVHAFVKKQILRPTGDRNAGNCATTKCLNLCSLSSLGKAQLTRSQQSIIT